METLLYLIYQNTASLKSSEFKHLSRYYIVSIFNDSGPLTGEYSTLSQMNFSSLEKLESHALEICIKADSRGIYFISVYEFNKLYQQVRKITELPELIEKNSQYLANPKYMKKRTSFLQRIFIDG